MDIYLDGYNRRYEVWRDDAGLLVFDYLDSRRRLTASTIGMVSVRVGRDPVTWMWIRPENYTNRLYGEVVGAEIYFIEDERVRYVNNFSLPAVILKWVQEQIVRLRFDHLVRNPKDREIEEQWRRDREQNKSLDDQ